MSAFSLCKSTYSPLHSTEVCSLTLKSKWVILAFLLQWQLYLGSFVRKIMLQSIYLGPDFI